MFSMQFAHASPRLLLVAQHQLMAWLLLELAVSSRFTNLLPTEVRFRWKAASDRGLYRYAVVLLLNALGRQIV